MATPLFDAMTLQLPRGGLHVLLALMLLVSCVRREAAAGSNNAKLRIKNDSYSVITLDWIHPETGEGVKMSDIQPQAGFNLDTFIGHKFKFIEQPNNGQCTNAECNIIPYVVDKNADMCKFFFR